jgi:hypothetical protein
MHDRAMLPILLLKLIVAQSAISPDGFCSGVFYFCMGGRSEPAV